ncbi:hypothetical protein FO584_09750 [Bacillus thuringiensis]|nr:hypothetical protein [Bacillus thuringiensis]
MYFGLTFFYFISRYYCRFLLISRYIEKIADINGVALIYSENRRYNFIYQNGPIVKKIFSHNEMYT